MKYILKTQKNESGNEILSKEKRNGEYVYLVMDENKQCSFVNKEWLINHKDYVVNLTVSSDNKLMVKSPSSPSSAKPQKKSKNRPEDFGEKIGGARKDTWEQRGLELSDLSNFTYLEREKHIVKDNVWLKPNYEKMVNEEGYDKLAAFFIKSVRTKIPTKPNFERLGRVGKTIEAEKIDRQDNYINLVRAIRDKALQIKTTDQIKELNMKWFEDEGYIIINGRYLEDTEKGANSVPCALINFVENGQRLEWLEYHMKKAKFLEDVVKKHNTNSNTDRKKRVKIEPLQSFEGQSYRNGKQIDGQDYLNCFKFRGGEFGNWLNDNDRMQSLNYGYDAFKDLAIVLGIKDEDISLGGKLAIAFGSRGIANAAAHFEPERNVINLTKMNGAGSLGHEWGHALDFYLGQLYETKCYMTDDIHYRSPEVKPILPAFADVMKAIKSQPTRYDADNLKANISSLQYDAFELVNQWFIFNYIHTKTNKELYNNAIDRLFSNREITFENLVNIEYIPSNKMVDEIKEKLESVEVPFIKKTLYPVIEKISDYYAGIEKYSPDNVYFRELVFKLCMINYHRNILDNIDKVFDYIPSEFLKDAEHLNRTATKMGDNYWNADCELFARAFACYVKDKLGRRSDYLIGHADSIEFGSPKGKERERINKAFDKLFSTLKQMGILHQR